MSDRLFLIVVLALLALAALPSAAGAATCSDYPSQATAQREGDTRDADGDGRYCETLPCPCAGAAQPVENSTPTGVPRSGRITRVVDGDTVEVGATTVRLIGIDTPESKKPGTPVECGALAATRFAERFRGRRVRLRTDPTQDTYDRYGRLLAYVDLRDGSGSVNAAQLRAGWAKVYVYGGVPFQRVRSFRRVQATARRADRGVWGRCGGDFHRG
jgi:micrococcal nuclease